MTALHDAPPPAGESSRCRRFRLVRGGRGHDDRVVPELPPKLVLLSPRSARWATPLGDALGPSYRVGLEALETPAAIVIDSREDDLANLVQQQRTATRVIVVHTGHPSEQPMAPAAVLDLGADTYLAPVSVPALAAHVKALTRSWDAFPPRPDEHAAQPTGQTA
jgi:hypothetical protein